MTDTRPWYLRMDGVPPRFAANRGKPLNLADGMMPFVLLALNFSHQGFRAMTLGLFGWFTLHRHPLNLAASVAVDRYLRRNGVDPEIGLSSAPVAEHTFNLR